MKVYEVFPLMRENKVILFLGLFCLPVADFLAFSDMGLLLGQEMSGMTGIHFVVRLLQDWVFLFVVCLGGLMMLEDSFRPGDAQYTDAHFHERFSRWLQTSVFYL